MFTNAQVMAAVGALDARIARIEAALVAGAPATAAASAPVRTAAQAIEAPAKQHVTCVKHGKRFAVTPAGAPTGSGFHAGWCSAGFEAAE
jgi:hypothetical protein